MRGPRPFLRAGLRRGVEVVERLGDEDPLGRRGVRSDVGRGVGEDERPLPLSPAAVEVMFGEGPRGGRWR